MFQIITLLITLALGVTWAVTGDFLWWGVATLISAVVFLISIGGDLSDLSWFD